MSSQFIGDWVGSGEGKIFARVHVRIKGPANALSGYAIIKALDGEGEIIEIEGKENEEKKATFELINYVSDGPKTIPPSNAQIILAFHPDGDQLEGNWVTDLGNHGKVRLRKSVGWDKLPLRIPLFIHKAYRKFKKFLLRQFRYAYFFSVVALAFLSILGHFESKISTNETIILLFPLVFLFSDKLREFVIFMAFRKVGPVEFQEQGKPTKEFNLPKLVAALHSEFGDRTALFSALTEFFVPRTKNLLRVIVSIEKPININEFNALCKKLSIASDNIQVTLEALVQADCLLITENGKIEVQDVAKQFLLFEQRLSQMHG